MGEEPGRERAPGVDALPADTVREAVHLLGVEGAPSSRAGCARALTELLAEPGAARAIVAEAPEGAEAAFARLVEDGAAAVEDLLGRGWWGRGVLPPPLDWLQQRGLIQVGATGLVHATEEARRSFQALTLGLEAAPPDDDDPPGAVRVEAAATVVFAPTSQLLDRALSVPGAALRAVAPTVAVSSRPVTAVRAALRDADVRLGTDEAVTAQQNEPALPTATEEAVGPRGVRALVERALGERRQVRLQYYASSRGGAATDRVVDPWSFSGDLLRGWCHLRHGERTFAVDRIGRVRLLPTGLEHLDPQEPDAGRQRGE